MADWRDNLRDASFRGIPFKYQDVSGEHGRRLAKHEYPNRDGAWHEDLGRQAAGITIQAYVLEPDHVAKAQELIQACEAAGAGTLVHPYFGERRVVCTGCRPRWTTREGGMCRLDLQFEEEAVRRPPSAAPDRTAQVDAAAESASTAIQDQFKTVFGVAGKPAFVADHAADLVGDFRATAEPALAPAMPDAEALAGLARDAVALASEASTLVRDPAALATRVLDLMTPPEGASQTPVYNALMPLSDWGGALPSVPATTATRKAQAANQGALIDLVGRGALIQASRAAVRMDYQTYDDAVAVRDRLAVRLDDAMAMADDTTYRTLTDLRAAVVRALGAKAPTLPRISRHTPFATRPALALAHELYGDTPHQVLARAEEIVTRNRLAHPGFAPGGDGLQILTEARDG